MRNYVIHFAEAEREAIVGILSRSNDIIINRLEPDSVGITIQLDDADEAYAILLERIALERRQMSEQPAAPEARHQAVQPNRSELR